MTKKKKKRPVTLIEIMIVILLIGIIGGALTVNMKGSLDHGKKFKTDQNIIRVKNILEMELAQGEKSVEEIKEKWFTIVADSPLANGKETTLDAHKKRLHVDFVDGAFVVTKAP